MHMLGICRTIWSPERTRKDEFLESCEASNKMSQNFHLDMKKPQTEVKPIIDCAVLPWKHYHSEV